MELHPGVAYGVTSVVVIGCHHIQEVGLDIVTGIAHVGVAHDDGRSLVGLGIGEHIVAQLTELTEHCLHESIALGIAFAVVGVHVGDVYVNNNSFSYFYFVVTEALLDAGIGTAGKATVLIVVLHHLLPTIRTWAFSFAGHCQPLLPEEAHTVGIGTFC